MCLAFNNIEEALRLPTAPVKGYKIYRIPYVKRISEVEMSKPTYETVGHWYAPLRKITVGDQLISNRGGRTLYPNEVITIREGIHAFTGSDALQNALNYMDSLPSGVSIIFEVEGQPEDFVAQGYWDDPDCPIENMVFTKMTVTKFICLGSHMEKADFSHE